VEGSPAKRIKVDESKHAKPTTESPSAVPVPQQAPNGEPSSNPPLTETNVSAPTQPQEPAPIDTSIPSTGPANPTPFDDSAAHDFDSMFDDAIPNSATGPDTPPLDFTMDLSGNTADDATLPPQSDAQMAGPNAFDGLLHGLESYANQPDVLMNFANGGGPTMNLDLTLGSGSVNMANTNAFDLPEIGDSSFDDLLNDDTFGGLDGSGGGGLGRAEADDMLDDSMMNLDDLDEEFFN
jgi:hypothetical protein